MELIQQNIAAEQVKYEQGATIDCEACKQKTLAYRLAAGEWLMRKLGICYEGTTAQEIYQFSIRNIEEKVMCYKCLLKVSSE